MGGLPGSPPGFDDVSQTDIGRPETAASDGGTVVVGVGGFDPRRMRTGDPEYPGGSAGWL